MLYTASYYAEEDWVGTRYRVSRGHPRGRKVQWQTLPFLYPARELMRPYRSGEVDFAAFSSGYWRGLEAQIAESVSFQEWLESVPALGDFTLLCFERAGQPCHRLVLAEWLLQRVLSLELGGLL